MAQNITIAGVSYPDVPSVNLPKTGGGNAPFYDTSDATANQGDILLGKTAFINGGLVTGNIPLQPAQTYTPTTSDIVIPYGKFLLGSQTILGDPNLIPENIAKNVTIFGVTGTHEGGGITFPSDWYVEQWTQTSDTQSLTFTHGLGQTPRFMVCICCDSDAGGNGRIIDVAISNADGSAWLQNFVVSWSSNKATKYSSQAVGYNGYDINPTTIVLTQGRYYSATFKANKTYLLLAHI